MSGAHMSIRNCSRFTHRCWAPTAVGHSPNSIRLVQPPQVESDRAELLLGDIHTFA